jgi:hypothetical protein
MHVIGAVGLVGDGVLRRQQEARPRAARLDDRGDGVIAPSTAQPPSLSRFMPTMPLLTLSDRPPVS